MNHHWFETDQIESMRGMHTWAFCSAWMGWTTALDYLMVNVNTHLYGAYENILIF